MKKLNLAVLLEEKIFAGGGYQQALNAAILAKKLPVELCNVYFFTTVQENLGVLKSIGIDAQFISINTFLHYALEIRRNIQWPLLYKWIKFFSPKNSIEKTLEKYNIDLVYFTSPSEISLSLDTTNFIITLWDLCHRDEPEFPEVRNDRKFEARERLYRTSLLRAAAIVVDSDIGKTNVIFRYSVNPERVYVIPFSPSISTNVDLVVVEQDSVAIKDKYGINFDYIYYPAQFWAHKNHVYLIECIMALKWKYNLTMGLVFSGGDAGGNLSYVKKLVHEYQLDGLVRFIGFVPNNEVPHLYKSSVALGMPTFFGPTNIPPLEAFKLGVPVLYSNISGLREQVGDAALLFDLNSPENGADQIYRLLTECGLRAALIERGKNRLNMLERFDRQEVLKKIISNFSVKRACWE